MNQQTIVTVSYQDDLTQHRSPRRHFLSAVLFALEVTALAIASIVIIIINILALIRGGTNTIANSIIVIILGICGLVAATIGVVALALHRRLRGKLIALIIVRFFQVVFCSCFFGSI